MVAVIVVCCQCNTSKKMIGSYDIIRSNYFSSNYSLPLQDTNKVNTHLYLGIFDRINFENGANCLLMKIYTVGRIWEEYGLYDYKSGKCYYTSIKGNNLYHFDEVSNEESAAMYNRMKKFINNDDLLQKQVQQQSTLFDGDNFEVSKIQVNSSRKEILVKSYYW